MAPGSVGVFFFAPTFFVPTFLAMNGTSVRSAAAILLASGARMLWP